MAVLAALDLRPRSTSIHRAHPSQLWTHNRSITRDMRHAQRQQNSQHPHVHNINMPLVAVVVVVVVVQHVHVHVVI